MRYLLICALLAFVPLPTHADEPAEGHSLFNGRDLTGWTGRSDLWSVEEGAIVGQTSDDRPIDANTFLIYEGDVPGDFELQAKFKIQGGNSGIQYRSRIVDAEKFIVGGYQADIDDSLQYAGINYDERGRGILAQRGTRTTILPDGTKQPEVFADANELGKVIRPGEWNDYRIVANGNTMEHYINDTLMSAVIDRQQEEAERDGVLALQLHRGPAMRVAFKDFRVRTLDGADGGAASSQSAVAQ